MVINSFLAHWDFYWYAKNIFFIVLIMVPSLGLGLYSGFRGITKMWKSMSADAGLNNEYRPSIVQFTKEFLWPSVVEIVKHSRFRECTVNTDRVRGHLPLMLAFIGLFIVTMLVSVEKRCPWSHLAIVARSSASDRPVQDSGQCFGYCPAVWYCCSLE